MRLKRVLNRITDLYKFVADIKKKQAQHEKQICHILSNIDDINVVRNSDGEKQDETTWMTVKDAIAKYAISADCIYKNVRAGKIRKREGHTRPMLVDAESVKKFYMNERYVSTGEAGALLNLDGSTVRRMCRSGEIKCIKVETKGKVYDYVWKVPIKEVNRLKAKKGR